MIGLFLLLLFLRIFCVSLQCKKYMVLDYVTYHAIMSWESFKVENMKDFTTGSIYCVAVFVMQPTGSGKSVHLFASLHALVLFNRDKKTNIKSAVTTCILT